MIRLEAAGDAAIIRQVTEAAFSGHPHSAGTEGAIVDALRAAGAMTLSLVAQDADAIIGHVAFSPVFIGGQDRGWLGLGPVSVRPDRQGRGIGSALIRAGLARIAGMKAQGCVVLGDPGYYQRFGFQNDPALIYQGVPPEYFMRLVLAGDAPMGIVAYHEGFSAT